MWLHTTFQSAEQSPHRQEGGGDVSQRMCPNNGNCFPSFGPHPNLHCKWDSNNYLPDFCSLHHGLQEAHIGTRLANQNNTRQQKDKGRKDNRMSISFHIRMQRMVQQGHHIVRLCCNYLLTIGPLGHIFIFGPVMGIGANDEVEHPTRRGTEG